MHIGTALPSGPMTAGSSVNTTSAYLQQTMHIRTALLSGPMMAGSSVNMTSPNNLPPTDDADRDGIVDRSDDGWLICVYDLSLPPTDDAHWDGIVVRSEDARFICEYDLIH
jgi:hypothetical protein